MPGGDPVRGGWVGGQAVRNVHAHVHSRQWHGCPCALAAHPPPLWPKPSCPCRPQARLPAQASCTSAVSRASKRLTFSAPPKCLLGRVGRERGCLRRGGDARHMPLDWLIKGASSNASCLTLWNFPLCAQPRLAPRANFSHSQQRVRQILRDNATLVKRLGCGVAAGIHWMVSGGCSGVTGWGPCAVAICMQVLCTSGCLPHPTLQRHRLQAARARAKPAAARPGGWT